MFLIGTDARAILKYLLGTTVWPFGLFSPHAIFATVLLCDIPADAL